MCEKTFEENNDLVREGCEKFYLDSNTADLNFIFGAGSDRIESVPAHKIILSISSPVFETMFYGSLKEKAKIPIVDATAEAFKEFLQLFYLTRVRLTGENIIEVSNLCKKYEVIQGIKVCETPLKRSLTFNINDVCSGYEVALLLELENVVEFCEQNIRENALEVLQTTGFSECDAKLFNKILRLVSSSCRAAFVIGKNEPLVIIDISLSSTEESHIKLTKSIIIDPNIEYGIYVEPNNGIESIRWPRIPLSSMVELGNSIEIHFSSGYGLVTGLVLQRSEV
ncbi:BTB/POZ domain-containing protein 6-B-like [Sitodiplosis mosellana]|uniref:BTB/POZ domain-containing protein 6-B-like n=1 Tax=Sitodiplosis mosellana TaxID=263140 RepID=UPI0024444C08|nr:BTB/POZ domain-containing protein 6-B-like [Sitodiplosis mosellana]